MCVSWGIQNCCVQVENAKCMCSSRKCKNVWCWSRKSRCTSWNASCQHDAPFRRVSSAVALQWPLEIARPPIYNIRASRKSFNVPKENYSCRKRLASYWPLQNVCPSISYTINWYMFGSHVFAILPCSYASVWWWTFKMLPSEMEVGSPEAISGTYTPECTFSKS